MLRFFLRFFVVCSLATTFVNGQQVTLSVGNVNALPGSQIVVPISIAGSQEASSLQFTLRFDSVSLSPSASAPFRGEALTDHTVALGRDEEQLTFVIFSPSLARFRDGQEDLVSVIFDVDGSAAGSITIEMTDEEGADEEGAYMAVVGADGSIEVGSGQNQPLEGQNKLVFPQIANGDFAGGDIAVLLVLANRTRSVADARVNFFKSDGSPFQVTLLDGSKDSTFNVTIAPGGSTFLATDGSGEISAGYARIDSTTPLGGVLVFTTRDPAGQPLVEAGVGTSPAGQRFTVPILLGEGGINTGLAMVNTSGEDAAVTLRLTDINGNQLDEQIINLLPGQHLPRFANELFGSLNGMEEFQGSIELNSTAPISAVALKTRGSLLTTFPVVVLPEE